MLIPSDQQWYRPKGAGDYGYEASDKGDYNGSCNRSCCQAPRMATWYNQSTQKYYCFECSALINKNVREDELTWLRMALPTLCIPPSHEAHPHRVDTDEQRIFDLATSLRYRRFFTDMAVAAIEEDCLINELLERAANQLNINPMPDMKGYVADFFDRINPPERKAFQPEPRQIRMRDAFLYTGKKAFKAKHILPTRK